MSKKHFISLPNGYLSYSAYSLWLADPKKYASYYFDRRTELQYTNKGQTYGKIVADALEAGVETGDLVTDAAMLLLPKYDVRDVSFEAEVKTKAGWLRILAKPDFLNSETKEIVEVKTGLNTYPWTQKKADNHLQMIFYAVVIWQKYGVMLDGAKLAWIETERVGLETKPTGRIEVFPVTFTKAQHLHTLMKIIEAAKAIEIAWSAHVTNPAINIF